MQIKSSKINKDVMLYLLITYGLIVIFFVSSIILKIDYKNIAPVTMIVPTIAAIIATIAFKNKFDYIKDNLRINKWTIIGPILIIIIFCVVKLIEIFIYKYLFKSESIITIPNITLIINQILIGIFIGGLSSILEEIGWRAFLTNKLKNNFIGYLQIGIYWSIFHIPQIFMGLIYNNYIFYGIIIQTLLLTSFNFVLCYVKEKSKSIINTAIMHGLFNALIFTQSISIINGVSQLLEGILWMIVFTIISVILFKNNKIKITKRENNLWD